MFSVLLKLMLNGSYGSEIQEARRAYSNASKCHHEQVESIVQHGNCPLNSFFNQSPSSSIDFFFVAE